jgi:hypothetical protein
VTGSIFDGSINASLLNVAYKIWEENESDWFPGENNVNPYALFAFDGVWLLIQYLQQLCTMNTENKSIFRVYPLSILRPVLIVTWSMVVHFSIESVRQNLLV